MAGVRTFTIHPRKGEADPLDRRRKGGERVIFPVLTPVSRYPYHPTQPRTIMVGPTAEPVENKAPGHIDNWRLKQSSPRSQGAGISACDCIAEFAGLRVAADGEDFIIGLDGAGRASSTWPGITSPGLIAASPSPRWSSISA